MTKDDEKTQALFSHQEGELELEDQTLEKIQGAGPVGKVIAKIKTCFGYSKPSPASPTPSPRRLESPPGSPSPERATPYTASNLLSGNYPGPRPSAGIVSRSKGNVWSVTRN